jgi:hypothetical protein
MLRADLRAIVHDEIASAARQPTCDGAATKGADRAPAAPPIVTPEALDAENGAQRLVERAFARKAWTQDDALAMRGYLGQVTGEQREDLLRQLLPAMNDGRIKVEPGGPPF